MKTGKSLVELATEIERQGKAKVDYIADTRKLELVTAYADGAVTKPNSVVLQMHNGATTAMQVGDLAHRQIGERVGIPAKYYDRMLAESPELLTRNVNHWFSAQPEKRLIRTLDGNARAFLSNRYQRVDNVHVAEVVLPALMDTPDVEVVSAEITSSRLYIKAVTHAVRGTVNSRRVGDVVEAGVMISNSEVGLGAISVMPFFHFLVCLNGMVRNKAGMRAAHIGTKFDGDENLAEILADDTRRAIDRGVLLKVRDVVRAAMNEVEFNKAIAAMQETTSQMILGNPASAIEVLANDFALDEGEKGGVLRHLIEGGDLSRYGLMNAITRTAEDVKSYDRATEIETLGGRLLDLSPANWQRIAVAEQRIAA
jgi:hypothetical protein